MWFQELRSYSKSKLLLLYYLFTVSNRAKNDAEELESIFFYGYLALYFGILKSNNTPFSVTGVQFIPHKTKAPRILSQIILLGGWSLEHTRYEVTLASIVTLHYKFG